MSDKIKILVINSNIELIRALEEWLELLGSITKSFQVLELKKDNDLLRRTLINFKPKAVIYDVSIPYEENWNFFIKISNFPETKNTKFIITTTNKRVLEKIVGPTSSTEIIGKPFEIDELETILKY